MSLDESKLEKKMPEVTNEKKNRDQFYSRPDAIPLPEDRPSFSHAMSKVVERMKESENLKVLDIGCGRKSDIGHYLKERRVTATIHGADIDEYSLKNRDVDQLFICDVADMPFEDDVYDIVFSQFLLEHVEDFDKTIQSIARVTAQGGLITLIIPNPTSPASLLARLTPFPFHLFFKKKIQNYENVSEDTFPTLFAFKSVGNLRTSISKLGFTDIEVAYIPEIFYRFRYRPILVRLSMLYVNILNTFNLNGLKASVVVSARKERCSI